MAASNLLRMTASICGDGIIFLIMSVLKYRLHNFTFKYCMTALLVNSPASHFGC